MLDNVLCCQRHKNHPAKCWQTNQHCFKWNSILYFVLLLFIPFVFGYTLTYSQLVHLPLPIPFNLTNVVKISSLFKHFPDTLFYSIRCENQRTIFNVKVRLHPLAITIVLHCRWLARTCMSACSEVNWNKQLLRGFRLLELGFANYFRCFFIPSERKKRESLFVSSPSCDSFYIHLLSIGLFFLLLFCKTHFFYSCLPFFFNLILAPVHVIDFRSEITSF